MRVEGVILNNDWCADERIKGLSDRRALEQERVSQELKKIREITGMIARRGSQTNTALDPVNPVNLITRVQPGLPREGAGDGATKVE